MPLRVAFPDADIPILQLSLQQSLDPAFHIKMGKALASLRAENIGVNVHYIPVPWHPYYERLGFRRGGWPVAEDAYERMLSLPIFPSMTDADVDDVVHAVDKVLGHYRR